MRKKGNKEKTLKKTLILRTNGHWRKFNLFLYWYVLIDDKSHCTCSLVTFYNKKYNTTSTLLHCTLHILQRCTHVVKTVIRLDRSMRELVPIPIRSILIFNYCTRWPPRRRASTFHRCCCSIRTVPCQIGVVEGHSLGHARLPRLNRFFSYPNWVDAIPSILWIVLELNMLQCYLAISEQLLQQNKKVELEASGVYLGMHEGGVGHTCASYMSSCIDSVVPSSSSGLAW